MTIYIAGGDKFKKDNLNIANLNSTEELYENVKKLKKDELNFYTLTLPKNSPLLYYTNIIYFDNLNRTLPMGMDVTTEVLINLKDYKLEQKETKDFRINYQIDEYINKIINVNAVNYVLEYDKEMKE